MPELPEVETVRRGLAEHLTGARITRVEVRRRDLRVPLPAGLEKNVAGKTLLQIGRRAKYLLFCLSGGQVMILHLGMSGRILLHREPPSPLLKHDHVIFTFANGYTLVFNDARRFGLVVLATEKDLATHALLKHLGPEPLEGQLTGILLYVILQASGAPVKSVIMDQRKMVGVGNIYACEALFRAGIHPARRSDKVTKAESAKLALAIKNVLEEAILSGGSTLRDYVRSSGDAGYFQHHFSVYGRQKKACVVCREPVKVVRQSGRSSFFCSHCQH